MGGGWEDGEGKMGCREREVMDRGGLGIVYVLRLAYPGVVAGDASIPNVDMDDEAVEDNGDAGDDEGPGILTNPSYSQSIDPIARPLAPRHTSAGRPS